MKRKKQRLRVVMAILVSFGLLWIGAYVSLTNWKYTSLLESRTTIVNIITPIMRVIFLYKSAALSLCLLYLVVNRRRKTF